MSRKRIDFFLNDKLTEFAHWLKTNKWQGKERDTVNAFAHGFIIPAIEEGAAITHPAQVTIEVPLRQVFEGGRLSAGRDLVIWSKPFQTAWDANWQPSHAPRVILEWKVYRHRLPREVFDTKDTAWLEEYTRQEQKTFGYTITVDMTGEIPVVHWRICRRGRFGKPKAV